MFMDLDGFKHINDSLGHPIGDKLLQSVAQRLVACVRGEDTVSRQGGDEFVVLLSEVHQPEDAAVVGEKMLETVAELIRSTSTICASPPASASASIPMTAWMRRRSSRTRTPRCTRQRKTGAIAIGFSRRRMNVRAVERQSIEEDLRRALERQEFVLHYQPKVDLRTGAITGAEALLGWRHPTRGSVLSGGIYSVAEDCGLIRADRRLGAARSVRASPSLGGCGPADNRQWP